MFRKFATGFSFVIVLKVQNFAKGGVSIIPLNTELKGVDALAVAFLLRCKHSIASTPADFFARPYIRTKKSNWQS